MENLKLYVWEDVLRDYTSWLVCILAKDLEQAREIFLKKYPDETYALEDFFWKPYKVVSEPEAFYVYWWG